MDLTSRYWQMVMLTSAGARQAKPIAAAQTWFTAYLQAHIELAESSDRTLQTDLWHLWKSQTDQSFSPNCRRLLPNRQSVW